MVCMTLLGGRMEQSVEKRHGGWNDGRDTLVAAVAYTSQRHRQSARPSLARSGGGGELNSKSCIKHAKMHHCKATASVASAHLFLPTRIATLSINYSLDTTYIAVVNPTCSEGFRSELALRQT